MNVKRGIGIALLIIGIVSIVLASYVAGQVALQSSEAQEKINKGKQLFQGNAISEMIGGAMAGSAEGKVAQEVAKYNQIVLLMRIGGIIVAVIGAGMAIFCRSKK